MYLHNLTAFFFEQLLTAISNEIILFDYINELIIIPILHAKLVDQVSPLYPYLIIQLIIFWYLIFIVLQFIFLIFRLGNLCSYFFNFLQFSDN